MAMRPWPMCFLMLSASCALHAESLVGGDRFIAAEVTNWIQPSAMSDHVVSVTGQGFTKARRLIIREVSQGRPERLFLKLPIAAAVAKDDLIRLSVRLRCASGSPGKAWLAIVDREHIDQNSFAMTCDGVPSEWQTYTATGRALTDLAQEHALVVLQVGFQVQTLEYGAVKVERSRPASKPRAAR